MGDTIMCLPSIGAARQLLAKTEVVGLVTPATRDLLALTTFIDRFVVTDGAPLRLLPAHRRAARELKERLARERFDLAVVFLGDDYAPMLTRIAIPHRVFVAESGYDRLATATYSIGAPQSWGPEERLGAWRALGQQPDPAAPTLRPTPEAMQAVAHLLKGVGRRPVLAIHPFGRTDDKWWPQERVVAFLRMTESELGAASVLVGSQEQGAELGRINTASLDLRGRLSLNELAALLMAADCVITTDSGPLHLAGSLARPTVGLFRGSVAEHANRYSTVLPIIAERVDSCGRCNWLTCVVNPCRQMASIEPAVVLQAVRAQLTIGSSKPLLRESPATESRPSRTLHDGA
jgi:ADP-heptose:LPS heptosyltransferase